MLRKKWVVLNLIMMMLFMTSSVVIAGTIQGTIQFEGKVPKMRPIKMDADPVCLKHNAEPVKSQILLLGEGNTLGNVFVHIVGGLPNKKYPPVTEPAILDQKGCMYSPHVLGVMVNQPIDILNPDGTLHNVHAITKINKEFNVAMPKFRKKITRSFDKAEFMLSMKCDVHPWMGAYIAVMEHPYFNVTGEDGQYKIENLPAGTYDVEAWHERLGTKKVTITVGEGDSQEANFSFTKPTKK